MARNRKRRGSFPETALAVLFVGAAACGVVRAATPPDAAKTPILLELFTSEGCSSCPPVDIWAEKLDHFQPITGAEIIVLSEHVDYWDHDGWKDPYSSAQFTARQRGYEQILGIGDAYTPQVILNGAEEVKVANSAAQIKQTFEKAATAPMLAVKIESAAVDDGALTGRVAVDATSEKHGGDVFVAITLDRTQTDVLAGENDGKKLTNVAVVRNLVKAWRGSGESAGGGVCAGVGLGESAGCWDDEGDRAGEMMLVLVMTWYSHCHYDWN
jgi:hypothetical protein